jgi:hypothetical protein
MHTPRRLCIPPLVAERPVNAPVTNTDSEKPPFLPILGYVLGFMVLLGVLAFVVAALLHLFRR